jgi:hypothetical protein
MMQRKLLESELAISGRSAAWLARLVRDQEAGGSNPLAPTILSVIYAVRELFLCQMVAESFKYLLLSDSGVF